MSNSLFNYFISLLRAFPCIMPVSCLLFGIIFQNKTWLIFGIYCILVDKICSNSLKKLSEHLYKVFNTDYIPILGRGKRPENAKYCGCFIDENNLEGKSTSFGMPSGHSMLAIFTAVFPLALLLDVANLKLFALTTMA